MARVVSVQRRTDSGFARIECAPLSQPSNTLQVLVLKGEPKRLRALADKLISCRGVKHGTFTATTTGQDLA